MFEKKCVQYVLYRLGRNSVYLYSPISNYCLHISNSLQFFVKKSMQNIIKNEYRVKSNGFHKNNNSLPYQMITAQEHKGKHSFCLEIFSMIIEEYSKTHIS